MPAAGPVETNLFENTKTAEKDPVPNGIKPHRSTSSQPEDPKQELNKDNVSKEEDAWQPLDFHYRFFLYGLCGLTVEIYFTALWQLLFEGGNRKLHGITSIYAFFIYGIATLGVERMSLRFHYLPWYIRGLMYLIWTYSWEFSAGLFLRQFDACPWDYQPYFRGHIMGLITMEYAPLWYVGTMFEERFIIRNAMELCWNPVSKKEKQQ